MQISESTYRSVINAMLYGIAVREDRADEMALSDALEAALDGDRERALLAVADVLCPPAGN